MKFHSSEFKIDFDYRGEIVKKVDINGLKIVITQEGTINRDLVLLNIYVDGKRRNGIRVSRENVGNYYFADVINRILFDEGTNYTFQ